MSLDIVPVEGRRALSEFVDVPWRIPEVAGHPAWVPPLRMMVRDLLDTKANPFYRNAERQLYVARRNGRAVGRIAAIENRAHNRFHEDRVGFFGFFECIDDPEVAAALLNAAADWLRARGLDAMRGPMHPSTNHDCGLLVEGFDQHTAFMTSWNPRYYETLLRGAGYVAVKELVGYWLPFQKTGAPERFARLAQRAREKSGLTFRNLRRARYLEDIEMCWEIYNSAWERNWGFVPMTRDEFLYMGKSLRPLVEPRFAFAAESRGVPVAFHFGVPDLNAVTRRIRDGRLLPFGFLKLLLGYPRVRTGRVLLLGIRPEHRSGPTLALVLHEAVRRAVEWGSPGAEASWVLEDNLAMRRPLESMGGYVHRRWRIFERALGA